MFILRVSCVYPCFSLNRPCQAWSLVFVRDGWTLKETTCLRRSLICIANISLYWSFVAQQIDHNEATSTSHATSIASASFCKSLLVNLGKEIVNRALEVNQAMEANRVQSQQQTSNSSAGGKQPADIITVTLQALGI